MDDLTHHYVIFCTTGATTTLTPIIYTDRTAPRDNKVQFADAVTVNLDIDAGGLASVCRVVNSQISELLNLPSDSIVRSSSQRPQ